MEQCRWWGILSFVATTNLILQQYARMRRRAEQQSKQSTCRQKHAQERAADSSSRLHLQHILNLWNQDIMTCSTTLGNSGLVRLGLEVPTLKKIRPLHVQSERWQACNRYEGWGRSKGAAATPGLPRVAVPAAPPVRQLWWSPVAGARAMAALDPSIRWRLRPNCF